MIHKTANLTVHSRSGARLLELEWRSDGAGARIVRVAPRFNDSVRRWLDDGLLEWVGPVGDLVPRVTPASSADFLPNIRRHLRSQFRSLDVKVAWRLEAAPCVTETLEAFGKAVSSNTPAVSRLVA